MGTSIRGTSQRIVLIRQLPQLLIGMIKLRPHFADGQIDLNPSEEFQCPLLAEAV